MSVSLASNALPLTALVSSFPAYLAVPPPPVPGRGVTSGIGSVALIWRRRRPQLAQGLIYGPSLNADRLVMAGVQTIAESHRTRAPLPRLPCLTDSARPLFDSPRQLRSIKAGPSSQVCAPLIFPAAGARRTDFCDAPAAIYAG